MLFTFSARMSCHPQPGTIAALMLAVLSPAVFAGTDGTFDDMHGTLTGWYAGSLGASLALASLVVGMGFSVLKRDLKPAVIGIGGATLKHAIPVVMGTVITGSI